MAGRSSGWPRPSAAPSGTTRCRSTAPPSTSPTTPSSDPRGGDGRLCSARPHEPGDHREPRKGERTPLEPALTVDELRLEEVDGDTELEESPVVDTRFQTAGCALDL